MFSLSGGLQSLHPASVSAPSPFSVAVEPKGRFAYAANFQLPAIGSVSMYSIEPDDGVLKPLSPATITAGYGPNAITVDPSGKFVYVANCGGAGSVSMYTLSASTGLLTATNPPTAAAGSNTTSIVVHPSGSFAYATGGGPGGSQIFMYTITPGTGVLVPNSPAWIPSEAVVLTIDPLGRFLYATGSTDQGVGGVRMYTINATTGLLTATTPTAVTLTDSNGIAIDSEGKFAYVTSSFGGGVFMYSIDQTTGVLHALSPPSMQTGGTPQGLTITK
jgi:6-phosphogluconolactonase (cycloisomerase 2 family)